MAPREQGSVTRWVSAMKQGDDEAASRLWERYFASLVRLVKQELQTAPTAAADEEDVALSVLNALCVGFKSGHFRECIDRHDLWRLLVAMARKKSIDHLRRETRGKRAVRRVLPQFDINQIPSQEPTPDELAALKDAIRWLVEQFDDDRRAVAELWLENYTVSEIAEKLRLSQSAVKRRRENIRAKCRERLELP